MKEPNQPIRKWVNVRLRCIPLSDKMSDQKCADGANLNLDALGEIPGIIVHDCTDFQVLKPTESDEGRLVLFCQVEIEADTEEEALDAFDDAEAYVPCWEIMQWSTVFADVDADPII